MDFIRVGQSSVVAISSKLVSGTAKTVTFDNLERTFE